MPTAFRRSSGRSRAARFAGLIALRRHVVAVVIACCSKGAPWTARLAALAAVAYAVLPFDLFPDLVPLLGQVDDLTVLTLAFTQIPRLIPPAIMERARARAGSSAPERDVPPNSPGHTDVAQDGERRGVRVRATP